MRLALMLLAVPLAGCFGPYAADLAPEDPPPVRLGHVWDYAAGDAEATRPASVAVTARQVLTGSPGGEPNIGITSSGHLFVTAYDDTLRSADGERWETVHTLDPPLGEGGTETGDPMLWVDPLTDRVYANHMYPSLVCFSTAWSDDDGHSWVENGRSCTLPGVDHQKFFTATPGPTAPAVAGRDHPTVAYQCYQRYMDGEVLDEATPVPVPGDAVPAVGGLTTHCNISYDGGASWPAETTAAVRTPAGCAGINGHPAAAPDGTIVVPITRGCDGLYVAVSTDSGLSWLMRPGPKEVGAESIDPDLAFTPDGTLYALWRGSDHLAYLARSSDVGATWDGPWRVSPPHVTSTVFQAISAGSDGRVAMAFLGTDDTSEAPGTASNETRWDLYIITSDDAAAEVPGLRAVRVNAETDPVQIGCVWLHGGGHPCRNMLDFIDSAVHPDGRFFVSFTKGCSAGCAGLASATAEDSRDRQVAVARLDGWSLHG